MMSVVKNITPESQALSAIHEEALKLLSKSLPQDVEQGVLLIESISRYKDDIRTQEERDI